VNKIYLCALLFCLSSSLLSQTIVKGIVLEEDGITPVSFVNIVVVNDSLKSTITYTYSAEDGTFALEIPIEESYYIEFSALGYETVNLPWSNSNENSNGLKINLKPKSFNLDEVIIHSEKSIKESNDTVVFNASRFSQGNEEVIEDLIRKLPGVSVTDNGTIKYGNQEIEKLMIDGEDFFERGYKILSKNMPPDQVKEIELLKRYSDNKLLKGVEESDRIAMNLVLKEGAKRQWFGNVSLGYDVSFNQRYQTKSSLMNFGKKAKYIALTNFNNIGYDATGEISNLLQSSKFGQPGSLGDNINARSPIRLSSFTPRFKAYRTNINNAELVSLNSIFTLSKRASLKIIGFFNWDENDFIKNTNEILRTINGEVENNEDFQVTKDKFIGFGKIDFNYDLSKSETIESVTRYSNQVNQDINRILFNTDTTQELLNHDNSRFDQKLVYTNKINKSDAYLFTLRYINESIPQDYTLSNPIYGNLFSENNITSVNEKVSNRMQFAGGELHYLNRLESKNLLEIQVGTTYRVDSFQSSFFVEDTVDGILTPSEYQNDLDYSTTDIYSIAKYHIKLKRLTILSQLEIHQLLNSSNNIDGKTNPLFINPRISLEWKINSKNILNFYSGYNSTNSQLEDLYPNFSIINYRRFERGTSSFNQFNSSVFNLEYQLGNWTDKFFVNASIDYVLNNDYLSTNSTINPNYSEVTKILLKDGNSISANLDINRYIKTIQTNFKVEGKVTASNFKNSVNNLELRAVNSKIYELGVKFRSGFQGAFNYHLGSSWDISTIKLPSFENSVTNNLIFLETYYNLTDNFSAELLLERYEFGNLNTAQDVYYFLDVELKYKFKNKKIHISLSGNNLFNTNSFNVQSISDTNTSNSNYKLLPRYILATVKYRF